MKITTGTGLKLEIDPAVFDDMELIDTLSELEDNPLVLSKLIKMLFGEEGKRALYDHCRDESGRVTTASINAELTDVFRAFSKHTDGKK